MVRLGALLHRQERWSEALDIFERLLQVVDRRGPTPLGATCHFYLGNIALHQGRLDQAAHHHELATKARRARFAWKALGASLTAQAAVALAQGDAPQALLRCSEAEQLVNRHETGRDELAFVLLGKGRALAQLGDLTTAQKTLRQALELRRGRDDLLGEAVVRLELGWLASRLGQPPAGARGSPPGPFPAQPGRPHLRCSARWSGCSGVSSCSSGAGTRRESHLNEAIQIHARRGDHQEHAHDLAWRPRARGAAGQRPGGLPRRRRARAAARGRAPPGRRRAALLPAAQGPRLAAPERLRGDRQAWVRCAGPTRSCCAKPSSSSRAGATSSSSRWSRTEILDAATQQDISMPVFTFSRQAILEAG